MSAVRTLATELFGTQSVQNILRHGGRTKAYVSSLVVAACVAFDEVAREVSAKPGFVASELRVAFGAYRGRVADVLLSGDLGVFRAIASESFADAGYLESEILRVEGGESSEAVAAPDGAGRDTGAASAGVATESLELPPSIIDLLQQNGYVSAQQILASESELEAIDGIGKASHAKIVAACKKALGSE